MSIFERIKGNIHLFENVFILNTFTYMRFVNTIIKKINFCIVILHASGYK